MPRARPATRRRAGGGTDAIPPPGLPWRRMHPHPNAASTRPATARGNWHALIAMLWLVGFSMRVTLLAIPPVIPQLQPALRLSQAEVGLLAGLPTLLFAIVAIPGAALIARIGIRRTILVALAVIAVAGAARAGAGGAFGLFAATVVMSVGIAVLQPALPPLVRGWAPGHVSAATAVYSNGMLGSEAITAALTLPVILPLLGGSWRASLAFWSLPVVLAGALFLLYQRRDAESVAAPAPAARWWPDWRDGRMWKLGLVTGGGSAMYYAVNGFLPGFLEHAGTSALITPALAAVNLGQIPPTIVLLFGARRVGLSRGTYIVLGLVAAAAAVGIVTTHGVALVACCAIIGMCCGSTITLGLALPALLGDAGDVHRLAGAMLAVGYLFATVVPIVGGIAWDATGIAESAFIPVIVSGILVAGIGALLRPARAAAKSADVE